MSDYQREILEGLKAINAETKQVTQKQGVMTDTGPGNAKAYSAILSGRTDPYASLSKADYPAVLKPIGQEGEPGHPSDLASLSDDELRQLVNILNGTKAGKKGAVGKRTKRANLLKMAAEGMGIRGGGGGSGGGDPPQAPSGPADVPPEKPDDGFAEFWKRRRENSKGYSSILGSAPAPGSNLAAPPVAESPRPDQEPVKLREAIQKLIEAITSANRREEKTVAQDVKGLSWSERVERLEKSGSLMSEDETKVATLKSSVTARDIVTESERREQAERDKKGGERKAAVQDAAGAIPRALGSSVTDLVSRIAGAKTGAAWGQKAEGWAGSVVGKVIGKGAAGTAGATSGAAGGGLGGAVAAGGAALANPYVAVGAAAAAASIALLKLPGAVEKWATSLTESQRHLSKYSATLMGAYARLDYQKRLLDMQQAQATGGSGNVLVGQLKSLRKETQWMREDVATLKNIGGTALAGIGRIANFSLKGYIEIQKFTPLIGPAIKLIGVVMDWFNRGGGGDSAEVIRHLQAMGDYTPKPKNRKPDKAEGAKT